MITEQQAREAIDRITANCYIDTDPEVPGDVAATRALEDKVADLTVALLYFVEKDLAEVDKRIDAGDVVRGSYKRYG